MRLHLDMADRNFILLSEEMERLRYYLNLEQMRFGEKLKYNIHIDESVNPAQIEIPNMIIQPFVENAIWHGIMPSDQKGKIQIEVRLFKSRSLEIVITDNGVGLNHASTDRKLHHESKGVKLIRERLALLDPAAGDCLVFEELTPGTKVKLTLSEKMFRPKKVVFDVENA
jgi:LytS/YehU family sensor histidine kinase